MIKIVFQNENFVVCDKPANVLSVPAREKNDPRSCLGLELQRHLNRQIFPVHRLDYEVSGLILFALDAKSHQTSQDWFLTKSIRKNYAAMTSPQNFSHWPESIKTERVKLDLLQGSEFFWKTQLLRGKKRSFESMHGEWAETQAHVIKVLEHEIHWRLFPITGKPHQLRFELSRRGFPILGDKLYGSAVEWNEPGIALRAYELDLKSVRDRLGLPEIIS